VFILTGCAPAHSAFDGRETDSWLAFDLDYPEHVDPHDIFDALFMRGAGAGCGGQGINRRYVRRGEVVLTDDRVGSGVIVRCADGVIAMFAMPGSRVRVGCERPTTRYRCTELLGRISEGWPHSDRGLGFLGGR
jgi:hypothetical protein